MIEQLFFELIQVSIGMRICLSHTPSADEWGELYTMAKKQSLVGVCFAGVQRLQLQQQSPEEMLYLTWMGMAAKIQQRNEVVNQQCVELQNRLAKDGLRSFLMKGQCNAALYGKLNALRQSGDIDVFVNGGREHVVKYVMSTAPTSVINEIELEYKVFADTEVDMHHSLNELRHPIRNRRLQKYLESYKDANFTNFRQLPNTDKCVSCPVWEYDLVFQLVHVYGHFVSRGVGFRQLMDYYFLLKNMPDDVNWDAVKKGVSDIGLNRFVSGLMWVLQYVFGLSMTGVPWSPDERDGQFLLNEVLISGNFGHGNDRIQNLSRLRRFLVVTENAFRYWRFDHWAWFWSPTWRIYHNVWKLIKGYKK